MSYTYLYPYGMNYNYGDSPYYKDEGEPVGEPTYRHQRAMYKLFPAGERLLSAQMIAIYSPFILPAAPILVLPVESSSVSTKPLFQWQTTYPSSDTYHIQVSTSYAFVSPQISVQNLTDVSYHHLAYELLQGTVYYWRVRGTSVLGAGNWSDIGSFTTLTVPPAPELSTPVNGATNVSTSVVLFWQVTYPGSLTYQLQISKVQTFATTVVDIVRNDIYYIYSLDPSTTYYWRVRGTNINGTGDWSDIWSFTTET